MSWRENLAEGLHAIRGTRSLTVSIVALLTFVALEGGLSATARLGFSWVVLAAALVGLGTLAREGIAVQDRVQALLAAEDAAKRLLRHAALPAAVVVLLWPQVFLAAYGIPHLSPITGLVLPNIQGRLAIAYLYLLMWLPILALQRTNGFAPRVAAVRPYALAADDPRHERRDALLLLLLAVTAVWFLVLRPYWAPFSLFQWPPDTGSLSAGAASVARILVVSVFPATLYLRATAYARAVGHMVRTGAWQGRRDLFGVVLLHLLLVLAAAALHLYDLLWVARYQSSVTF